MYFLQRIIFWIVAASLIIASFAFDSKILRIFRYIIIAVVVISVILMAIGSFYNYREHRETYQENEYSYTDDGLGEVYGN